jgi:hypothetical protein
VAKEILLGRGMIALVDDDDYESIADYRWFAVWGGSDGVWYARRLSRHQGKAKTVRMHRVIMNAPVGTQVDHINGNGLDNRKSNLRLASPSENQRNRNRPAAHNKSGFRGVCAYGKRWRAAITPTKGKNITLGYYDSPQEASAAYEAKARELFGEFYRAPVQEPK